MMKRQPNENCIRRLRWAKTILVEIVEWDTTENLHSMANGGDDDDDVDGNIDVTTKTSWVHKSDEWNCRRQSDNDNFKVVRIVPRKFFWCEFSLVWDYNTNSHSHTQWKKKNLKSQEWLMALVAARRCVLVRVMFDFNCNFIRATMHSLWKLSN